jgi:hypothetical protein
MGWTDYHLNEFTIKGQRYTIPNMIGNLSACGKYGSDIKLEEFGFRKNEKFLYTYDFTAGWEFRPLWKKTQKYCLGFLYLNSLKFCFSID